jgi:ribosomal protein L21
VLMLFQPDGSICEVGKPHVSWAHVDLKVDAKILGEKIRVTKFKRKNRYQRTIGFRPKKHLLKVQKIVRDGGK